MGPFPPTIITDCQSLLMTTRSGTARATAAKRPLARIWNLIAAALDGRIEALTASGKLVWMPAHRSLSSIGEIWRSDGRRVKVVDWRANQLADALAKMAAPRSDMSEAIDTLFATACEAAQYELAMLG
eukprot:5368537-Karenia_brevis.AAC.1